MKIFRFSTLALGLFASLPSIVAGVFPFSLEIANAEYRAYRLRILNNKSRQEKFITATLDDLQYRTYYSLQKDEKIEFADSWMCWNHTGNFQPICPNPKNQSKIIEKAAP